MHTTVLSPKQISALLLFIALIFSVDGQQRDEPIFISGVYPHLTTYADNGNLGNRLNECGIGAVVPWAGKLWMVNYAAHEPFGSDHKLYSIGEDLELTIHPESVGGTPAGRMIHKESNQLLMAHYVIDQSGKVRAVSPDIMPGRITAFTRHLKDPENWVYVVDMEGMIYELNVYSLEVRKLFHKPVPGWHAKGAYIAQGKLIVANNGEHVGGSFRAGISEEEVKAILARIKAGNEDERGSLSSWDGEYWEVLERKQYTDVTGPGGLKGNANDTDQVWTIGWDNRSLRLKVMDEGQWSTYLLPKASFNNDAIHGWYTEWPRIRELSDDDWMMDMHGMFFDFPPTFSASNTAGLSPIGSHLRYVPDFCEWNGRLILATDETSIQGNPRAGQPQSNLWFGKRDDLKKWGPGSGYGGPWINDPVAANVPSLPFLVNGFKERTLHLVVHNQKNVTISIEVDYEGTGDWKVYEEVSVTGYVPFMFPESFKAQWVRLRSSRACFASGYFHQSDANYRTAREGRKLFSGLADLGKKVVSGSALYALKESRNLALSDLKGTTIEFSKEQFAFVPGDDLSSDVKKHLSMKPKFYVDEASVVVESHGERLRLPKGDVAYDKPFSFGWPRTYREIESERELANIHGTFYELPLVVNDKPPLFQKLRPISSHRKQIADFASWNGLLVMSGVGVSAKESTHIHKSDNGKEALWFGAIDDLWKLGKPVGVGGPWKASSVKAGDVSDPYLMTGYDKKKLILSADEPTEITLEINFDHFGYHSYRTWKVVPGSSIEFEFPKGFSAHWARLATDSDCVVSATFIYE
jgi:hypothetical protein|tara:strand:+ start:3357 stop:5780 length:2424 start_codon:yes stop_codon:yes gene_type:complete